MSQQSIDMAFERAKLEVEIMIEWKFMTFNIRLAHKRGLFNSPKQKVIGYLWTPSETIPIIVPDKCAT